MTELDRTHAADAASWVETSREDSTDFPVQNLPLGVFRSGSNDTRIGVAIGDRVLNLWAAVRDGLLEGLDPQTEAAVRAPTLNPLMALGRGSSRLLRHRVFDLLSDEERRSAGEACLVPMDDATMVLPVRVAGYTDFYASIHHATNVGSMFRPDNPLLPNYKWVPIGYHGRTSSIVVGGTPVRRPAGQLKGDEDAPAFGPTRALDYECEVGLWVGPGNQMGSRIDIGDAHRHVFGLSLLNDWSARDIQGWEYQPLGPFLSKSFATSVSPWVVTADALEPFRAPATPRPQGDPTPLPHLYDARDQKVGGIGLQVEVYLASQTMRDAGVPAHRLSRANLASMYWTPGQLVTHHTSNGCNLQPGDLLGSGTVSEVAKDSRGCLLELTWRGADPITLPTGETRRFLEDGDEVTLRGHCERDGFRRIGVGECRGVVQSWIPAPS